MNAPWSEREAETWAKEWCDLYSSAGDFEEFGQQEAFHAALAKAAEFIAKQANQEFDEASAEIAARKWVDGFYPNRFDDHGDYNQFVGFCVYGMRWQHARDFATIKARDARIAELEEALRNIVAADAPYSTHEPGVSRLKHCVAIAREALKGKV